MSAMDDFNRFAFERAKGRYIRAQYDQMTTDDWVALVEGYKSQAEDAISVEEFEALEEKLADAEKDLDRVQGDLDDANADLAEAREKIADLEADLAERD